MGYPFIINNNHVVPAVKAARPNISLLFCDYSFLIYKF